MPLKVLGIWLILSEKNKCIKAISRFTIIGSGYINGFLVLTMDFLALYSWSYMALNDLSNVQVQCTSLLLKCFSPANTFIMKKKTKKDKKEEEEEEERNQGPAFALQGIAL